MGRGRKRVRGGRGGGTGKNDTHIKKKRYLLISSISFIF
jgi:hypothetical protein